MFATSMNTLNSDLGPSKKKKRASLVCTNCKKKKVKCDRGQPCDQCIRYKKTDTCQYDEKAVHYNQSHKHVVAPYMESARKPLRFDSAPEPPRPKSSSSGSVKANSPDLPKTTIRNAAPNKQDEELELLKHRLSQIEHSITNAGFYSASPNNLALNDAHPNLPPMQMSGLNRSSFSVLSSERTAGLDMTPAPAPLSATGPTPIPMAGSLSGRSSGQGLLPGPSPGPPLPRLVAKHGFTPQEDVFTPTSSLSHQSGSTNSFHSAYTDKVDNTPPDILNKPFTNPTQSKVPYSIKNSYNSSSGSGYSGINPYLSDEDSINFYEGYSSVHIKEDIRRLSFGPFSWSSLMQKDSALKILWDHTMKIKESSAKAAVIFSKAQNMNAETIPVLTSTANDSSINLDEQFLKKKMLEPEGLVDIVPYYKLIKSQVEKKLEKSQTDRSTLPLGLTYVDGKLGNELRLIDKIQLFLPKQRVIWKLIRIFFMDVYPFMPLVNEPAFRGLILRIIGPEDYADEKISNLNIEKRLDLAYIGTLLIMLRLAYLSLFTNRIDINEKRLNEKGSDLELLNYKYLLSNPITINIIDIAQECLEQFNLFNQPSFPVITLAYYTKLYHTYAPEDGEGADGDGTSGISALLIRMAISLGFNREPDKLPDAGTPSPTNNIIRRMWHYLVLDDLYLSYSFGQPVSIPRGSYDTKVPFYRKGEECLNDTELDKFITESLFSSSVLYNCARHLTHLVVNVEGRSKMKELCENLSELESTIYREYGTFSDCLNPKTDKFPDLERVFKCKFYISIKSFCVMLFFYFYNHYEDNNVDLAFFYMRKLLLVIVGEMMPHYVDLVGSMKHDMVLNPKFELFVHKSNQILISFVMKCNFLILNSRSDPEFEKKQALDTAYANHYNNLCKFSSSLTRCLEVSIALISKISNRYYHAWRITKGHTFLLKTITNKDFYNENSERAKNLPTQAFSSDQLVELIEICETTMMKLGKQDTSLVLTNNIFEADDDRNNMKGPTQDIPLPKTVGTPKLFQEPGETQKDTLDVSTPRLDLDFFNSAEVDKLWMQMLNNKQDLNDPMESVNNMPNGETPGFGDPDMVNFDNIPFRAFLDK